MSFRRWPDALQPRPWEYRWRALPLFLSQGAAVLSNAWLTGSFAMPTSRVAVISVVLGAVGLWLRVWGVGLISAATMSSMTMSTERLVTTGIYGLVRNPLYLGDLFLFVGYGLFLPPVLAAAFIAFHLIRTMRLITFEEARLAERHGVAYAHYLRQVPRLWPRLSGGPPAEVDWREGLLASAIWAGFAVGYVAVWLAGDVWALTPFECAGFLFGAVYFSYTRRVLRRTARA
jgi:protein-S-isoprenylcysteine O-methyltransferase Ste14